MSTDSSTHAGNRKVKGIRDPIYGLISIDEELISSPYFQRLRYVVQNGMAYLVFPSMRHSRFEHSLGTYYQFQKISEKLRDYVKDELELVGKLALYHDIGHLPFSHTFEYSFEVLRYLNRELYEEILKKVTGETQKQTAKLHEYMGMRILREIKEEEVADLMKGVYQGGGQNDLVGLATLIINSKDLDIDRLDYLQRDSYYSGTKYGLLPVDRLWDFEIVKKNEKFKYLFRLKSIDDLEHYFLARYHMYSSIYNHCVVEIFNRIMAFLIAKLIADGFIKPEEIYEPSRFLNFTDDSILAALKVAVERKEEYRPFYESIYLRRKYSRAMLTGDEAQNLKSILEDKSEAEPIYSELVRLNGSAVIGANEIVMESQNILIRKDEHVKLSLNESREVNLPSKRYKVCIGVYDSKAMETIINLFKRYHISLNFRNS
ncbi:MAG: HD domain-containing protein [Metallosphaera prunae]|uniref:HD domain-containing protein n=1 Tax=Metallosphaera prunae TaxID=47304 RepID=UPI002276185F|nr:HD domain-containing protein [Metallosphaera prunae]MCY0861189.1 HD domain-containing protein [Metallosphaera prunae]